jgi:hypothetical protein
MLLLLLLWWSCLAAETAAAVEHWGSAIAVLYATAHWPSHSVAAVVVDARTYGAAAAATAAASLRLWLPCALPLLLKQWRSRATNSIRPAVQPVCTAHACNSQCCKALQCTTIVARCSQSTALLITEQVLPLSSASAGTATSQCTSSYCSDSRAV